MHTMLVYRGLKSPLSGTALAGGSLDEGGWWCAAVVAGGGPPLAGFSFTKLSGNIPLAPFKTPSHQPSSTLRVKKKKNTALLSIAEIR